MSFEDATKHLQELEQMSDAELEKKGQSQEEMKQWATFTVADELYGIDVMQVKEVLRFTEITPVPGSLPGILGIINLRGNVVTVISTRDLFNLPSSEINSDTRIVVAEFDEEEVIGMLVDGVDEVINLPISEVDRAPNVGRDETARHYVQGVCYRDEQLIILLDLAKMLSGYRSLSPDYA